MNGFINLYKPSGITSAYALNLIKKKFRGQKIGHMGTLDPLASGVLPIAIGKSTRLFNYLLEKEKVYIGEFTFGYETDTLDRGGKIIKEGGKIPTLNEVLLSAKKQIGEIDQIPPMYSAKNVDGKRSYELAREGKIVQLKPKKVLINDIELLGQKGESTFIFKITCGGGTYIRSICRDIAYGLNTFATMTSLERIKSGVFTKNSAVTLEFINNFEGVEDLIIPPEKVVNFEQINLLKKEEEDLLNGRPCKVLGENRVLKVYGADCFIGIGEVENGFLKIKAYLKD